MPTTAPKTELTPLQREFLDCLQLPDVHKSSPELLVRVKPVGADSEGRQQLEFTLTDKQTPPLPLEALIALSEFFGTRAIGVMMDIIHNPGWCETCDIGGEYGHELTIRSPTKNIDFAFELKGGFKP